MKLYVIGLGPGEQTQMTPKAMAAIADSDVIAGYTVYIDLIKHLTQEKEILTTPMKQEVDRCRMAIEEAVKGKTVSMPSPTTAMPGRTARPRPVTPSPPSWWPTCSPPRARTGC